MSKVFKCSSDLSNHGEPAYSQSITILSNYVSDSYGDKRQEDIDPIPSRANNYRSRAFEVECGEIERSITALRYDRTSSRTLPPFIPNLPKSPFSFVPHHHGSSSRAAGHDPHHSHDVLRKGHTRARTRITALIPPKIRTFRCLSEYDWTPQGARERASMYSTR